MRCSTKAVDNYQKAAEKLAASPDPADKKLGKLSLEYLVASYGPDKLNDPAKAEPVVQRMIQLEPSEPTNYFALAKIYEDAGAYDEAEKMLVSAKNAKPGDPAVYMTLAGYYNRQGHFDKTIEALEERAAKEPNNPEAFYTIATYYWDEAYRDFKLKDAEKRDFVGKGMTAVDHALQLKPDYVEAIVYKGLLLRLQAQPRKGSGQAAAAAEGRHGAQRKGERHAQGKGCRDRALSHTNVGRIPTLRAFGSKGRQGVLAAFFCLTVSYTPAVKYPSLSHTIQFSQEMVAAHASTPWRTHESHYLVEICRSSDLLRPAVARRPRGRAGRDDGRHERRRQGRAGRRDPGRDACSPCTSPRAAPTKP